LHSEDDDFGQAGTLYREVFDAEQRARFLETLTGQGRSITIDAIRERFFQYWTNVDADLGAALRARF
ncbi:catalase-related domain-containing protein, partial [Microbacterium sp. BF1]